MANEPRTTNQRPARYPPAAHDPELAKEVRNQPDIYIPCLEHAAVTVLESLRNEAGLNPQKDALVTGVGGSKDMFDKLEIQVHLVSDETPASIRSLNSAHVSKLVYIPGIVIAAAKAKTKATRLCL